MWDWLFSLFQQYGLPLMFSSAFLSATILPGNSELVFMGLAMSLKISTSEWFSPAMLNLLLVAALGNSLGSFTSYWIGYLFPKLERANPSVQWVLRKFARYGSLMLLLSWLPIVGDVICVAAGWQRLSWRRSLCYISLGKLLRYVFLWLILMSYAFL